MTTTSKIILGTIALILIAQHQLGRYLFKRECQTNEGAWVKPIDSANSLAYDILDSNERHGFDVTRPGSLVDDDNRRAFVEFYAHYPSIESLTTEPGWYRYWLARKNDPNCASFYATPSLHGQWRANLTDPRTKVPRLDPDAVCIASKKIDVPASRYMIKERSNVDLRMLGIGITSYNLIDYRTGETRIHQQQTTYLGPWIYEGLDWLAGHLTDGGLAHEYCQLSPERYDLPPAAYKGPISTLDTLASEGWPMLPAATRTSK